jgi:diketogulonate reductase-like aldo/keto reductase
VSNFDAKGMGRIWRTPGGTACAVNQVYYSASQRGVEHDLLPWQRERAIPTMAYCPIDQGALATDQVFTEIGARHGVSAAQAALAWVMREPDVIAIPKAVSAPHLRDNFAAAGLRLTARDLTVIDIAFPPPDGPEPLAMV